MAVKKRPKEKEASSPPSSATSNPGVAMKRRGKNSGWPTWLWVVGAFGLVICLGQIFAPKEAPPAPKKKSPPAKASKANPMLKKKEKTKHEKGSTMEYLELAMRLAEMTQIATQMSNIGELNSETTQTLDAELNEIESDIEGLDGSTARDLRAMVSVIRGTLYQQSENLTDEQVAKMENSFTYANPAYWDEYYKKTSDGERYDWYGSWDTAIKETAFTPGFASGEQLTASKVGDLLLPYLKKDAKILMFGCGNSDMSEKMYKDGYENIVNIDISPKLIDGLKERLQADMPKMSWAVENASALSFETGSFDIVLDKGTFDAIEQNLPLLTNAAKEAHRVLRSDGFLLSVTFNDRSSRVERQLGGTAAGWRECHEHPFDRISLSKTEAKDGKAYYVHACSRN